MSAFRRDGTDEYESRIDKDRQVPTAEAIRVNDKRRSQQPDYLARIGEGLKDASQTPIEKTLDEMIEDCFMEPGPGRVVVQPDGFKYRGKLIIPDSAKRNGTTGIVLKVGFGCEGPFWDSEGSIHRPLMVGDRIAYGTWTGILFTFDQRPSYRVLMESEVATIVNNKATKLLDVEA